MGNSQLEIIEETTNGDKINYLEIINATYYNKRSFSRRKTLCILLPVIALLTFLVTSFLWTYLVCIIPITAEVGTTTYCSKFENNVIIALYTDIQTDLETIDHSKVGKNSIDINFLGIFPLKKEINFVDTTPPQLVTKDVSKSLNSSVTVYDFIQSCNDVQPVECSLNGNFNNLIEGAYNLTVKAVDLSGNKSESNVILTITADKTAPVISGVKPLIHVIGEDLPEYLDEVYAIDDVDGKLSVAVDYSSVNIYEENTYKIYYKATDKSGNEATKTTTVTVKFPTIVQLEVENILQNPYLPNGCEVVSLAIALNYAGYDIHPMNLYFDYMPKTPIRYGDPWTHYMGDATGVGYGCYAPCVVKTGNDYLEYCESTKRVYDVSGKKVAEYREYIDNNTPVIFWGLIEMNGNDKITWEGNVNGKKVDWHSFSHCVVLIGYTDHTYIFCDPLQGIVEYSIEDVEASFAINYRQACVIKEQE